MIFPAIDDILAQSLENIRDEINDKLLRKIIYLNKILKSYSLQEGLNNLLMTYSTDSSIRKALIRLGERIQEMQIEIFSTKKTIEEIDEEEVTSQHHVKRRRLGNDENIPENKTSLDDLPTEMKEFILKKLSLELIQLRTVNRESRDIADCIIKNFFEGYTFLTRVVDIFYPMQRFKQQLCFLKHIPYMVKNFDFSDDFVIDYNPLEFLNIYRLYQEEKEREFQPYSLLDLPLDTLQDFSREELLYQINSYFIPLLTPKLHTLGIKISNLHYLNFKDLFGEKVLFGLKKLTIIDGRGELVWDGQRILEILQLVI